MNLFRWISNQPYILLTISALCWGGNAVAGKLAVGHISPFFLTTLRWSVALAILLPFAWPHLKREWPTIKSNLLFLFALGAIGFGVFNNLMYLALTHTTAINVAIVQASMPVMVFALNFILFSIRATSTQLFGFLLTLIGVAVITVTGDFTNLLSMRFNIGDLLMLTAIMFYGAYSVFLKNKPDLHWLSLISILAISAFIVSLFFTVYEASTNVIIVPDLTGWAVVFYTAIFASLFSQICWIRGLEIIGSNAGGVFINLVPIFGTVLAILILEEVFQLYHLVALVLVIGGIWIAQQKANKKT